MKRILYILSFLLAVGWVLGAIVYKTGGLMHVLLILSVLMAMQAIIICPRPAPERTPN